jgi:site-specific recombinase XerD
MEVSACVRVSGPLSRFRAGFSAKLAAQGYTDLSLANQLRVTAHFSRWLEERHLEVGDLTSELVDRYLAFRRRTRTCWTSRRALAPLLEHLGVTAAVASAQPRRSGLLERYRVHLVHERALSTTVRAHYEAIAQALFAHREPARLTSTEVMKFVRRLAHRPGFAGHLSALRAVLRFLHVSGELSGPLVSVVPSTCGWRAASLPRALEPAEVGRVLASPDRRTDIGRRDYAVLLLMLRLGLRACEVAALTLDAVDWMAGEIVVHGKGGVASRLPLPTDVGRALVSWARRRRQEVPTRAMFLRSRAPYGAASAAAISGIATQALRRGGVPTGGGHRLRHTAATLMLHRGASLTEIAQVLRHRHIDTTAIYAKVDRDALRGVVQAWPTDCAIDGASLRTIAQPWPGGVR